MFRFFDLKTKGVSFWGFQVTGGQFFVYFLCLFLGKFFGESLFLYFIFPLFFILSLRSSKVKFINFFALVLFIVRLFKVPFNIIVGILILRFLFFRFFRFFPYLFGLFECLIIPFQSVGTVHYILNERLYRFFFSLFKVFVRWFFRIYWFICFYRGVL